MLPKHVFKHRRVIPLHYPQNKYIMERYKNRKVLPPNLMLNLSSLNNILSFPDVIGEFKLRTSICRQRFQKSEKILPRIKTDTYSDKCRSNTEGPSRSSDDLRVKYYQRINSEVSFCLKRLFGGNQNTAANNIKNNLIVPNEKYYEYNLKYEHIAKHQRNVSEYQSMTKTQIGRNTNLDLQSDVYWEANFMNTWESNTPSNNQCRGISLNSPQYAQIIDSFDLRSVKEFGYPKTRLISPFFAKLTSPLPTNSLLFSNTFEEALDVLPSGYSPPISPYLYASRNHKMFDPPDCEKHLYTTKIKVNWDCRSLKRKRSDSGFFDNNLNLKKKAKPSPSSLFSVNIVGNSEDFQKAKTYFQNQRSSPSLWRTVRVELNETREIYNSLNELASKNANHEQHFIDNKMEIASAEHFQTIYDIFSSYSDFIHEN